MKILLLDNFDSFTYNLYHYLEGLDCEVKVLRNNQWNEIQHGDFDKLVLSPGPGLPKDAGCLLQVIEAFHLQTPMLGVCLGMQALAEFFGDELYNLKAVRHGVSMKAKHLGNCQLFEGIPTEFEVGLYHSWAVRLKQESPLQASSFSEDGVLMSLVHKDLPLFGLQFHPESILSPEGKQILHNFVKA